MTVCSFFLQGRCRYGEKCWNEHPRGGRGGGDFTRGNQPSRGGGFGNRVWVNPSQRPSGGPHSQPSLPPRGPVDWGGGRDAGCSSSGFSQNRFAALNSPSNYDNGGSLGDENEKHLEAIQKDMEVWQSSGQWPFSCYSLLKAPVSGFVELSPEELRLEHFTCTASGDVQSYVNSVQRLASQWRTRVQELRTMNPSTRAAMTAELSNPKPSAGGLFSSSSSEFNSSSSSSGFRAGGFGPSVQSSSSFSFSPSGTGFGSRSTQPGPSGFGSASGFGPAAPPVTPSASSFSFTAPAAGKSSAAVPGSAAGFSFSSSTPSASAAGFGTCFGSSAPAGGSVFGLAPGGSVGSSSSSGGFGGVVGASVSGGAPELYTPRSELTAEELKQFTAARFMLGQIPLRPPPVELLTV